MVIEFNTSKFSKFLKFILPEKTEGDEFFKAFRVFSLTAWFVSYLITAFGNGYFSKIFQLNFVCSENRASTWNEVLFFNARVSHLHIFSYFYFTLVQSTCKYLFHLITLHVADRACNLHFYTVQSVLYISHLLQCNFSYSSSLHKCNTRPKMVTTRNLNRPSGSLKINATLMRTLRHPRRPLT